MVKDRLAEIQMVRFGLHFKDEYIFNISGSTYFFKLCNISSNVGNKTIIDIEPSDTELEIIVILNKVCQFFLEKLFNLFGLIFQLNSNFIFFCVCLFVSLKK